MTTVRRDKKDTQYGNWMRKHPLLDSRKYGYDSENLDYIWFAFSQFQGWYILIEEKRNCANQSNAQKDTHSIIDQHLKSVPIGTKIKTMRGEREIEYRGYYLIQFQNTNPSDSQWCKINGVSYKMPEIFILCLQKFGILLNPNIDFSLPSPVVAKNTGLTNGQVSLLIIERKQIDAN